MLAEKTIGVVVPAYNEELLVGKVIETMPEFVDKIIVVDDYSKDHTTQIVEEYIARPEYSSRLELIRLGQNSGVGRAIVVGYRAASKQNMDVVAVMAGDAQMDPDDLDHVVLPVVSGKADYVKGNRLFTGEAWQMIPRYRYLGNAMLSLMTKISSGYWHIADSQTGYTAISKYAIDIMPLEKLYPRYGYPNHILCMLNVFNMRVKDVPIKPIYNIGEKSGIRLWKVIPTISKLLVSNFLWRMKEKYIIRDFHPLVFFYALAFLLLVMSGPLFARMIYRWIEFNRIPPMNTLAFMFTSISGLQSLFFAMWFDMDYNKFER